MNGYNEIEPYAAQWLENLSSGGHIAPGRVDRRSIRELTADDVRGLTQFHTFAGIGVWSYALRLAGWPDDVPVWTGSCPCQPFSAAGRRGGFDDERHLWPEWFRLIRECRPPVIFGEQVASPDGLKWFDLVSADLEGAGYAVGAVDLCAAGVGAPHIRQRLYFVAVARRAYGVRRAGSEGSTGKDPSERGEGPSYAQSRGATSELANNNTRLEGRGERRDGTDQRASGASGVAGLVGDPGGGGGGRDGGAVSRAETEGGGRGEAARGFADESLPPGPVNGFWRNAEWIACRDGKARPVEPGTFPLVDGAPGRVGRLRAYGNALVAPVAATFIRAALGVIR